MVMSSDLAVVCFPTLEGAERAFADVRERCRHAPWLDEVAFVEHRRSALEAKEAERLDGELFRDLRETVPVGKSGLVLLAEAQHVDAMLDALRGTDARLAVRKTLSDQAVAAVEAAVARAQ